jgi:molybdopterin-binding protein
LFRLAKFLLEALQTTQWPKEKVQKDKQRSTKYTHKAKITQIVSGKTSIAMSPEGSIWIGLGGTTKLTANITTTSVDSIKIYWQRVENNSIARNIVLNTIKDSGSSCDVPVPELVINDVDTTDAGLYQIEVTTITESFIGPRVAVEVIGGKLFLLYVYIL